MAPEQLPQMEWYNPEISNPDFSIRPIDLDFRRSVYRASHAIPPPVELPLHTVADRLADSPWLAAAAGYWMFNPDGRAVIDAAAWPGEVRWLPLVIQTPFGPLDDYQILAPPLQGADFLSEPHTTRDSRGKPVRWVLDRDKIGDRQVLMVPGVSIAGLVLRGRILQRLLDLGAKGIVIERARVTPPPDR